MMWLGSIVVAPLCTMREPTEEMAKSRVFLSLQVRIIWSRDWKTHEYQLRVYKGTSHLVRHHGCSARRGEITSLSNIPSFDRLCDLSILKNQHAAIQSMGCVHTCRACHAPHSDPNLSWVRDLVKLLASTNSSCLLTWTTQMSLVLKGISSSCKPQDRADRNV